MSRSLLYNLPILVLLTVSCRSQSASEEMEEHSIEITTPSAGWGLRAIQAYESKEAIICLFQLDPPKGMSAQVISKVQVGIKLPAVGKPMKPFVLGKTWSWDSNPEITFIDFPEDIAPLLANANPIEIQPKP